MLSPADDISRFSRAQAAGVECAYERALAELRNGRKRSHWIWFVLPQLQGLGRSDMAQRYGLEGLAEAHAYLVDPLLRRRLEQVIDVIHHQLQHPDQTLECLKGGELDATKTISSLTLFEAAGPPLRLDADPAQHSKLVSLGTGGVCL